MTTNEQLADATVAASADASLTRNSGAEDGVVGGYTPLYRAVDRKDLESVQRLIKAGGVNVNEKCGPQEWAPLLVAVEGNFLAGARVLLEEGGADVNVVNQSQTTPLHLCCQYGWLERAEFLIQKHQAQLDLVNDRGDTGLMIAADRNHASVVRLLLDSGADMSLCNQNRGMGPLGAALAKGYLELLELLLDHHANVLHNKDLDEIRQGSSGGWNVLHNAAKGLAGVPRLVQHLESQRLTDLANEFGPDGSQPLHIVASGGRAAKLFHQTPDVDAVLAALECLVQQCGANVNAPSQSPEGCTPLFLATVNGASSRVAQRLLELGADPNLATHDQGQSPLMAAAHRGDEALVRLLLARAANVSEPDLSGNTPLEFAIHSNRAELVQLILDRYCEEQQQSTGLGRHEIVSALMQQRPDEEGAMSLGEWIQSAHEAHQQAYDDALAAPETNPNEDPLAVLLHDSSGTSADAAQQELEQSKKIQTLFSAYL